MKIALAILGGMIFVAGAQPASAASASGHSALALGAIVGAYSTKLTSNDKALLARLLDGKAVASSKGKIQVKADAVICRAGDVDIASFGCELTFGTQKVELTGR